MDKLLYEIINEATPQIRVFHDGFFRREASLLSFLSIGGRKISDFSDFESFCVFLEEHPEQINNVNPAVESSMTVSTKERILDSIKNYPSDVKEYYLYYISTIRKIIASFKELIPSDTDAEGQSFRKYIEKISELFSNIITSMDAATHESLRKAENKSLPKDESKALLQERFFQLGFFSLTHIFVDFNMMTMLCMHFHQLIYEYYYGPKDNKDENADKLKQMYDLLTNIKANQDNTSLQVNSIKKDTEQILNSRETKNESLKAIKENQEKIKELVKDRNEMDAEKAGTLSVEECVVIIGLITKHYFDLMQRDCKAVGFPPEVVKMPKESTIRRNIEFWDQYQNGNKAKGRKPPRKDYSRNKSKKKFGEWYNEIQLDRYNKWKAKNRIDALRGKSAR